ncbi:SDX1 [Acrasis kona]|uniref:SDX1 n=1 Tax=Acrasis kona TaxID=1008807 RepID=A0AAW2YJL8_9EUKA
MMKLVLLCFVAVLSYSYCSEYDPHVFKKAGPWFEGWYTRITDHANERSLAVINAMFLNKNTSTSGYLALMFHDNRGEAMEVWEAFPSELDVSLCDDREVTKNPDLKTPPCFRWNAKGSTECEGSMIQTGPRSDYNFTVSLKSKSASNRGATITFTATEPTMWDDSGLGPEGIADKIPLLGLYWFVYSLGSKTTYEFQSFTVDSRGARQYDRKLKGSGIAHQEKNWGDAFPKAWIWAESVNANNTVHFALAGGPKKIPFTPFEPVLWLVGYRSPKVGAWNFKPQNLLTTGFKPVIEPCKGVFNMTIESFTKRLAVNIVAKPTTFKNCLFGPTEEGFQPMCLESFVAHLRVEAFVKEAGSWKLVDKQELPYSALEFGGKYTCKPCVPENLLGN